MSSTLCSIARAATFAAAAFTLAAQAATAQDVAQAPRVEVNLKALYLTTPESVDMARHQINKAAWAVCRNVVDLDGLRLAKSACVQTARAQGNQQLGMLVQRSLAARANTGQPVLLARKAP